MDHTSEFITNININEILREKISQKLMEKKIRIAKGIFSDLSEDNKVLILDRSKAIKRLVQSGFVLARSKKHDVYKHPEKGTVIIPRKHKEKKLSPGITRQIFAATPELG